MTETTRSEGHRVAVIGAGHVGSTYTYALLHTGAASEILLVDKDARRAEGEAMDLSHGLPFLHPARISAQPLPDVQDVDLIVLAAGAFTRPGETRLDLLGRNAGVIRDVVPELVRRNPDAVFLLITNPVDILTEATVRVSGLPFGRVLGSGTVLDSARFRQAIGERCGVAARNIHAYVVGEHGDSEVPVWSSATLGGARLLDHWPPTGGPCPPEVRAKIDQEVRTAAYRIVERKGATYFGIGLSAAVISRAILRDEQALLTVSVPGPAGVSVSVPCLVGRSGVQRPTPLVLEPGEEAALARSRALMGQLIDRLELPERSF